MACCSFPTSAPAADRLVLHSAGMIVAIIGCATRHFGESDEPGAIDFGLIVDGAVIIVENSSGGWLRRGQAITPLTASERHEVIRESAKEVLQASQFAS